MKQNTRYFYIGCFVLTGFLLLAFGCILFGGSELFARKVYFETYFNSSVQGLDAGGAVKFRGVPIGKVESISFAGDVYECPQAYADCPAAQRHQMLAYVRVVCSIDIKQFPSYTEAHLEEMAREGLRTSLGMQGITGIVFVNLDYEDPTALVSRDLPLAWTPEYRYIPSTPTVLQTIVDVADNLCKQLEKVDIAEALNRMTGLAGTIDTAVKAADIGGLSASIRALSDHLTALTEDLNKALQAINLQTFGKNIEQLTQNIASTSGTIARDLPGLAAQTKQTMTSVETLIANLQQTLHEVNQTLGQVRQQVDFREIGAETASSFATLSRTAAALEALVESLRERPSRLFFDDSEE